MLNAIRGTRGGIVTSPESRIDFDNFVLRALDPFLLPLARDGFLRTLQREKFRGIFKAVRANNENCKSNDTFTDRHLTDRFLLEQCLAYNSDNCYICFSRLFPNSSE